MHTQHTQCGTHRHGHQGHMNGASQARHQHDKSVFQTLLAKHDRIQRQVENRTDGIRSVTTSEDSEIVALLHDHVPAMHQRLNEGFALRRWDPLYVEIFQHAQDIKMEITLLPNGVEVLETSEDPQVAKLIQAHGAAVDGFVAGGHAAASQPSPM